MLKCICANDGALKPELTEPLMLKLSEVFNYNHKITTDVYASYKFSKMVSLFIGADNVFNVHPNLGVSPLAKGYAQDNESGGAWDSVQMGFNGRRLFAKLAFNF